MKKSLLLVALLLVVSSSFAQYKPEAKSVSTEVQFNPFDQNGKTFKLDGLKVRYFITEKDAVRVKVGLNLDHEKWSDSRTTTNGVTPTPIFVNSSTKATMGDFNMNFGYERHFDVAKRISVYVGGGLGFNRHFASSKTTLDLRYSNNIVMASHDAKIHNGILDTDDAGNRYVKDRGAWGFDAAVFTGLDFYVYKGLYIGTEFGLGLKTSKTGTVKVVTGPMNGISQDPSILGLDTRLRTTTFGFFIEPTLRLGWTF